MTIAQIYGIMDSLFLSLFSNDITRHVISLYYITADTPSCIYLLAAHHHAHTYNTCTCTLCKGARPPFEALLVGHPWPHLCVLPFFFLHGILGISLVTDKNRDVINFVIIPSLCPYFHPFVLIYLLFVIM